MSRPADRNTIVQQLARKTVVYQLPGMDALPVRQPVTYRATSGSLLPMELYYPATVVGRLPCVLAPLAFPDAGCGVRMYGPVTSWLRLFAMSGMAAVVYGNEAPERDVHAALAHLRNDADALRLDPHRIGLFATSGNATVALSALIRDRRIRCAAFLYGYTMDIDGSTAIADASRQFGFVDACANVSANDLPDGAPMLLVRAGRDQFPGLNGALDAIVSRGLANNLPFALINHATGGHGFDLDEDTDGSRAVVRQVLAFLSAHLDVERRE
jgi:hypothetical protein